MDETNISTPDANITITDNTVEHIICNTRTIKIDRSKLMIIIMRKWQNYSCHVTANIPKLKPKRSSR